MDSDKVVRFTSCFICEVNIDDAKIELVDSTKRSFYIDKDDDELMAMFKEWFTSIYKSCLPQQLTIVQYSLVRTDDGDFAKVIKKIIWRKIQDSREQEDD